MNGELPLSTEAIAHAARETGLSRDTVRSVVRSLARWVGQCVTPLDEGESVVLEPEIVDVSALEPGEIDDPNAYEAALADGRVTELRGDELFGEVELPPAGAGEEE